MANFEETESIKNIDNLISKLKYIKEKISVETNELIKNELKNFLKKLIYVYEQLLSEVSIYLDDLSDDENDDDCTESEYDFSNVQKEENLNPEFVKDFTFQMKKEINILRVKNGIIKKN